MYTHTNHMVAGETKTAKQLERHCKGVANHWRIEILRLIARQDGLTLDEIATCLDGNFKTISEHTRKLVQAGLLHKKYKGRSVLHTISPYGKIFADFLARFSQLRF